MHAGSVPLLLGHLLKLNIVCYQYSNVGCASIWCPITDVSGVLSLLSLLIILISFCSVQCAWRWGLYEGAKSSYEQGGCGTRKCWWASSWGAGFHEQALVSQGQFVGGLVSPEHLCVWRWSLLQLQERQRQWDWGGPAPFHHHDAHPCDPAHLCTWRRHQHSQQGDNHQTVTFETPSSPVDQNKVKCLSSCMCDSIPNIFQRWSPRARQPCNPRISVCETCVSVCGLLSWNIVHLSKHQDLCFFPYNTKATALQLHCMNT